jgi:hypothetical protein
MKYGDREERWTYVDNWENSSLTKQISIPGFFEGSVIHGTRFVDTNLSALIFADKVQEYHLRKADKFVIENLSYIIHGNHDQYHDLYRLKSTELAWSKFKFRGTPFYLKKGDSLISQFDMSTGECILVTLLHMINNVVLRSNLSKEKCLLILIDEVEISLHPSAIKRLMSLLNNLMIEHNLAIYFTSHSIEIIREVEPSKIYYLNNDKGIVSFVNPCFPAYATRNLYEHDGYDFLILVEDNLARTVIEKTIREKRLFDSKLVQVLATGGWEETLRIHDEVIKFNLLGHGKKILSVLDGDIIEECNKKYLNSGIYKNLTLNFLPIKSVEKYLRDKLIINYDLKFIKEIGDMYFRVRSIQDIINDYKLNTTKKDNDGKILFMVLKACANEQGINEFDFRKNICEFIYEFDGFSSIKSFLERTLR